MLVSADGRLGMRLLWGEAYLALTGVQGHTDEVAGRQFSLIASAGSNPETAIRHPSREIASSAYHPAQLVELMGSCDESGAWIGTHAILNFEFWILD